MVPLKFLQCRQFSKWPCAKTAGFTYREREEDWVGENLCKFSFRREKRTPYDIGQSPGNICDMKLYFEGFGSNSKCG